jgi:hypothetical protein
MVPWLMVPSDLCNMTLIDHSAKGAPRAAERGGPAVGQSQPRLLITRFEMLNSQTELEGGNDEACQCNRYRLPPAFKHSMAQLHMSVRERRGAAALQQRH